MTWKDVNFLLGKNILQEKQMNKSKVIFHYLTQYGLLSI